MRRRHGWIWRRSRPCPSKPPITTGFRPFASARAGVQEGGRAPTILNAANEAARVARFLEGEIGFLEIAAHVEETLARMPSRAITTLEDVIATDAEARRVAVSGRRGSKPIGAAAE